MNTALIILLRGLGRRQGQRSSLPGTSSNTCGAGSLMLPLQALAETGRRTAHRAKAITWPALPSAGSRLASGRFAMIDDGLDSACAVAAALEQHLGRHVSGVMMREAASNGNLDETVARL